MAKWPSINPGELRKTVQILQQTNQVDGLGQPQNIWDTVWTCKAAIDDAEQEAQPSGRELYDEGLISARVSHVITIRWVRSMPQIFPGQRVLYVDQMYSPPAIHTYLVEFIENAEQRNVMLRLGCWEINAPG